MPKEIEPKLKLVSAYLKPRPEEVFFVPEYQRAYSWTLEQCDKLWQDIEAFIDNQDASDKVAKEPYFFGTIIADCSISGKLSLIDGQQRTTTFILLFKALLLRIQEVLRVIARDDDTRALVSALESRINRIVDILYKTDDDSRVDFLDKWDSTKVVTILENKSINELAVYKADLVEILKAEKFEDVEPLCHKIPRKKEKNKYTNYFRNFKFFYEQLQGYSETKLNRFAKALISECQVIEIRSWDTEQAITMFNSLNATGLPLVDSDIISAQMYANAGDKKERLEEMWRGINGDAKKLDARKIVDIDAVLRQYMYIRRAQDKVYVREGQPDVVTPGLRKYYMAENAALLADPLALCEKLEKIVRIWDAIKDYPLVKILLKFNENAKIYLVSYLNRYEPEELGADTVVPVVKCLIKLFAILELVDINYSSSKFKVFLFGEALRLVDKNIPEKEIVADFASHIARSWKPEEIKDRLLEFEKHNLVYLNEYLYAEERGEAFDFDDSVNVEHIMPASGHNKEMIRVDAGIGTPEEFKAFVNKLGNKILLEAAINDSIGNDWFKTKKQKSVKEKAGYKDSRYLLARSLTQYPSDTWTKTDIDANTGKAASRILSFIFS